MPRKIRSEIRFVGLNAMDLGDRDILLREMLSYRGNSRWLVDFLVALLEHPNPNLRYFACGCLGTSGSRHAYVAMLRLYHNRRHELRLRRMAGNALGFLSSVGRSKDVIRVLGSLSDDDLLIAGVNALGYYRDRRSENYLLRILRDSSASANVRAYAAESLGLHSPRAVKGLIKTIADGPLAARFFAARALGWIGDKRAVPALLKMAAREIDVLDWQPDGGPLADEAKRAIEWILKKKSKP